jgi:hypothetical protein
VIWDLGFEFWDLGFGICNLGFVIWDLDFGIWNLIQHVNKKALLVLILTRLLFLNAWCAFIAYFSN